MMLPLLTAAPFIVNLFFLSSLSVTPDSRQQQMCNTQRNVSRMLKAPCLCKHKMT